jgi:hypothetical protein
LRIVRSIFILAFGSGVFHSEFNTRNPGLEMIPDITIDLPRVDYALKSNIFHYVAETRRENHFHHYDDRKKKQHEINSEIE